MQIINQHPYQCALIAGAAAVSAVVAPVTFSVAFVAGTVFSTMVCFKAVSLSISYVIDKLKYPPIQFIFGATLVATIFPLSAKRHSNQNKMLILDTIPVVFYSSMNFLFRLGFFASLSGVKSAACFVGIVKQLLIEKEILSKANFS